MTAVQSPRPPPPLQHQRSRTLWPSFLCLAYPLALHLERPPPSALRIRPAQNPNEMVFFLLAGSKR